MAARSRRITKQLPRFIQPMLAKPGVPFDGPAYLFEIKWDGTRTLALIERDRYRLLNRRQVDMTDRYPEFAFLASLPAGTVLDGEVVVLRDGKPDFGLLQSREHSRSPLKIRSLARSLSATYVVFDLLYSCYQPILSEPLETRRKRLQVLLERARSPRLILSEGVVGQGREFFEQVCRQGLEGVIAKRLRSPYLPGKRTDAWIKVKRSELVHCLIIGFLPAGREDFRSLILAAEENGRLRPVGKVGTGFDSQSRGRLNRLLWSRLRGKPVVPCREAGKWVEPGLYCTVKCMERTPGGELRAPSFGELFVE